MIIENKPLSMAEALEFVKKDENSETDVIGFIKKFNKMDVKKAKELRKKIEELDLLKIKGEHVAKIIDLMPENSQDLNKIFVDVALDEDETKKILEAVKQFK